MNQSRPRPGRINGAGWMLVGLAALGACMALSGCAAYRAERAQFESRRTTVYPTSPSATFNAGRVASVSDRE